MKRLRARLRRELEDFRLARRVAFAQAVAGVDVREACARGIDAVRAEHRRRALEEQP